MDAFDTANGQQQQPQPMNSFSPGGTQPPGDAFDSANAPPPPKDAFDSANQADWGTLAHQAIAAREATQGPMHPNEKLAMIEAYRQQYGGQAMAAPNESLQQMAVKTAADNTFMQNASAAFGNSMSRSATGAVGLISPATGQALRQDQQGAYGEAQPGSVGGYLGETVGGAVSSAPAMFGGPAGLILSAAEAAGNKRVDIADQRSAGANISGGREALSALGAGAVDYGTNLLAQKLLGHVNGRMAKAFGGEIAGALEAGDAGGAATAVAKMIAREFGKEVVGNQAIAQIQNAAQNAVSKITQPGTPLTANAREAAVQALIQAGVFTVLGQAAHAAGAHGGEGANPTPELPADYSPLDIRKNVGPFPEPGTVGKRMYASSDDVEKMFHLTEGANAGDEPPASPAAPEAHPPVLDSPAHVGEYYGKTYSDNENAATIEAMASMNPGRFVRAQVPIDRINPGTIGENDKSQAKIDEIAALTPEQRQKLNPGILIGQRDGTFMPADGSHRLMGAMKAGDKVYRAYVPESAIGKNGVVADTGKPPAETSPVEAPATNGASPEPLVKPSVSSPELQPSGNGEAVPAQTEHPAIAAAREHFPDMKPVEPQTREQKEAASVAQQLGVNSVFYTGAHEGRGFVLKDHPDTVFISAPSNRGVDAIRQAVGHELTRSLARTAPAEFKPILDAIPDAELTPALKEYRAKLGTEAATDPHESAAALVLGKAAMNERVWRAMSGKNPTAFEAFADNVSELFGKLTTKGRTLNKIVDAWNKVRPELQERANETVEKNEPDANAARLADRGGVLAGDSGRGVEPAGRSEREATKEPAARVEPEAVPAADKAARKADLNKSPVLRQFDEFKAKYPDHLILFKMGDFYEAFHGDADALAKTTGVAKTVRRIPGGEDVPMAGVPFHAVEGYLRKLIAAGHKVAIAEPAKGEEFTHGADREIVRTAVPAPEAPPKNAKEAKARRAKKADAAQAVPEVDANGRVPLEKLTAPKTVVPPDTGSATAQKKLDAIKQNRIAAENGLSSLMGNVEQSREFRDAMKAASKGLRGREALQAKARARGSFLENMPEYREKLNAVYDLQGQQAKIRESMDALEHDRKAKQTAAAEADTETLRQTMRQYPWWELEQFVRDRSGAGDMAEVAKDVLREKIDKMNADAVPPEGSEKLAKPSKAPPPALVRLPAGQKSEFPPLAEKALHDRAATAATREAVPATDESFMKARKFMVDKYDTRGVVKSIATAQNNGATNFKQFLRTVPEFALDPKFTVNADQRLQWNDANGGHFTFAPEHLGILPAGDVLNQGETIGVDPEAVKAMKKGDTLIVHPGDGGGAATPPVEMLPSANAIAKGFVQAGPSFFQQDVIPSARNGIAAVKQAIASADRFWNGSALDPTADTTKEHLREAWARNDLDRIRTEAMFKPARKMAAKLSEAATVQAVEAVEAGQPMPDAKMQPFADEIRRINADLAGEAAKVGLDSRKWTPDYIRRIFEFPDPQGLFPEQGGAVPGWTSSIAGAEHFLKSRVFDNFGDSLAFVKSVGGRLKYDNFIDMQMAGWEQIRKGIAMRREFNEAIQRGDVAEFAPHDKLPDGWKYLDDKLATTRAEPTVTTLDSGRRVQTDNIRSRYAAPETIANIFNDNLAPGLYSKLPLWKRWTGINHLLTSINLGLSGAHMMNMATGGAGISFAQAADNLLHGEFTDATKNAIRGITAPIYHAWHGSHIRQAARVAGGVPGLEPLVDATVAGGGRFGFDSVLDKTSAQKALADFKSGNVIGGTGHAATAAWKALSYPLFKMYIPNIKASLLATAAETELQRAGTRDELREAMGRHSNAIDNVLGEVVHDNKFQHRMIQDAMQGIFLAPNWNEGLARLMGGSARDYVRAAIDMKNGKSPTVTPAMLIPFGAVMAHMMYSAAINRALSGQWPQTFRDYIQPRNGQKDNDGNDMRVNLLTPFKDAPAWASAPGRTLWNKLSPLIHMIHDIAENSDYHGVEVYHPGDPALKQAGDIAKYVGKAALPFSVQSYERMKDVGADAERKALGFAGLNPAPPYVTTTKAEQLAQELRTSAHPPGTRTQEQYDKSELVKRLAQAVRSNQPGAGQAARDALKAKKITDEDYVNMIVNKNKSYLQRTVTGLGVDDAMRVWNVASDDEKRSLVNDMIAKVGDAKEWDTKPDEMKQYLTLLRDERIRLKKAGK